MVVVTVDDPFVTKYSIAVASGGKDKRERERERGVEWGDKMTCV